VTNRTTIVHIAADELNGATDRLVPHVPSRQVEDETSLAGQEKRLNRLSAACRSSIADGGPLRSRDVTSVIVRGESDRQVLRDRRILFFGSALRAMALSTRKRERQACTAGYDRWQRVSEYGTSEQDVSVLGDDLCRRCYVTAAIHGEGAPGYA